MSLLMVNVFAQTLVLCFPKLELQNAKHRRCETGLCLWLMSIVYLLSLAVYS